MGHKVQNPAIKTPNVVALIGGQGHGKDLLGLLIGSMFGKYSEEINGSQLTSHFNEWAALKLFVLVDELVSHDKRVDGEIFKAMVSRQTVWIR